jgi:hypothetical protein
MMAAPFFIQNLEEEQAQMVGTQFATAMDQVCRKLTNVVLSDQLTELNTLVHLCILKEIIIGFDLV